MLLEPVIGALLGTAAGTAPLPGLQTWLGDLVVAGGTFMVIYAGSSKKESIDATEALRPRTGATLEADDTSSQITSVVKSPLIQRVSRSPLLPRVDEKKAQTDDAAVEPSAASKVVWTTD